MLTLKHLESREQDYISVQELHLLPTSPHFFLDGASVSDPVMDSGISPSSNWLYSVFSHQTLPSAPWVSGHVVLALNSCLEKREISVERGKGEKEEGGREKWNPGGDGGKQGGVGLQLIWMAGK